MDERPSPLLVAAAILYFAAALPLLFAPEELLGWLGGAGSAIDPVLLQVLSAALFGFALLDWMSRYTKIGGIYGRPLVLANFAHAAVAVLSLARVALRGSPSPVLWAGLALYAGLAVAFGARLFVAPRVASGG
jgi:hypothetical protein